jgi:ERF superfamily
MRNAKDVVKVEDQPVATTEATSILAVIERAARSPEVDIDKMERLMAMHERASARQAKTAYFDALAQMQPELPIIGERGGIKDRSGNVQSRYALWEDVVSIITPILSKHGFSLSFRTGNEGDHVKVTGVLAHRAGHSEETLLTLPVDTSGSKNAVQSVGSSTSYGKRYTASALLNLRSGETDDDGQAGGSAFINEEQIANLLALATEVAADMPKFLKYIGASEVERIPASKYQGAMAALEKKRKQA